MVKKNDEKVNGDVLDSKEGTMDNVIYIEMLESK